MGRLQEIFPNTAVKLFYVLNLAITLLIIWFLFAIIFKVLPDAIIGWRHVGAGAFFTAVLFLLGRFGISFYIGRSNIGTTYGTAGSLVALLVWVYYSAIILYFGAEFTKAYAVRFGDEIRPNDYAVMIQTVEIETGRKNVQENERDAAAIEVSVQKANDDNGKAK